MTNATESEQLTRVGPGTMMGDLMRQYWLPAAKSSELVAGGDPLRLHAAGREADRLPRPRRPCRRHGPPLPASRRIAVLRPQRGGRPALRLSRLEVRRRRQLRRHAERAAGAGLQAQGARQGLPGRRSAAASSGSTWARARTRRRCRRSRRRCCRKSDRPITFTQRECNWLQALEGDIDTSHFSLLHVGSVTARAGRSRQLADVPGQQPRARLPCDRHRLGHHVLRLSSGGERATPTGASRISASRSGPSSRRATSWTA